MMLGLCNRKNCQRQADRLHPEYDVPVCFRHVKTPGRRYYNANRGGVFAMVQGGAKSDRGSASGSVVEAGHNGTRTLKQPWRTWEAPGPVTVRKWDGN